MAYAICVLTPPAALAFATSEQSMHCLGVQSEMPAMAHVHDHAQAVAHHAESHEHGKSVEAGNSADTVSSNSHTQPPGQCCGLFCVSALAPSLSEIAIAVTLPIRIQVSLARSLAGQYPDRIDRPPRSLVLI